MSNRPRHSKAYRPLSVEERVIPAEAAISADLRQLLPGELWWFDQEGHYALILILDVGPREGGFLNGCVFVLNDGDDGFEDLTGTVQLLDDYSIKHSWETRWKRADTPCMTKE